MKARVREETSKRLGEDELDAKLRALNRSAKQHAEFQLLKLPSGVWAPVLAMTKAYRAPPLAIYTVFKHYNLQAYSKIYWIDQLGQDRRTGLRGGGIDGILKGSGVGFGMCLDKLEIYVNAIQAGLDDIAKKENTQRKDLYDHNRHTHKVMVKGKSPAGTLLESAANGMGGLLAFTEYSFDKDSISNGSSMGAFLVLADKIIRGGVGAAKDTKTLKNMSDNQTNILIVMTLSDILDFWNHGSSKGSFGRVRLQYVDNEGMQDVDFEPYSKEEFVCQRLRIITLLFRIENEEGPLECTFLYSTSNLLNDWRRRKAALQKKRQNDDKVTLTQISSAFSPKLPPPSEEDLWQENSGEAIAEVLKRRAIARFRNTRGDIDSVGKRFDSNLKKTLMEAYLYMITTTDFKTNLNDDGEYFTLKLKGLFKKGNAISLNGIFVKGCLGLHSLSINTNLTVLRNVECLAGVDIPTQTSSTDSMARKVVSLLKRNSDTLTKSSLRGRLKPLKNVNMDDFSPVVEKMVLHRVLKAKRPNRGGDRKNQKKGVRLSLTNKDSFPTTSWKYLKDEKCDDLF